MCRYIFLQLCAGGDLFSYIVHHTDPVARLNEGEAKYIMYQLLLGLNYLHEKHISHRGARILICISDSLMTEPVLDVKVSHPNLVMRIC